MIAGETRVKSNQEFVSNLNRFLILSVLLKTLRREQSAKIYEGTRLLGGSPSFKGILFCLCTMRQI